MAGTTITGTISTGLTLHGTLGASQDTPTGTVVTGSSIDGQMVGGPKGEAATVTVGTVTTGAPSSVTNSGSSSAAVLDFVLEQGAAGDTGPANTLAIGTVTSGPTADATITGTAPNQTLSLTLPKGDTGAQGLQGVKGDTGEQGPQGLTGLKGDKGDQGIQGIQGIKGDTGSQGIQGPIGLTGDTGPQGPKGDTGAQGSTGPIGLTGLTGSTGATGAKGDVGEKGDKGDKGDDGDPGPPNTLTAGTVAQIPAGGQPTVSITGTAPNQTLNLGLVDGTPTAFELRGEGFPGTGSNATATNAAAVGTYYTDTLGTNGAWRWLKTSAGTGNAQWGVVVGDTGWRNVTSLVTPESLGPANTGTLAIRRTEAGVALRFIDLLLTPGAGILTLTAPSVLVGFRPITYFITEIARSNSLVLANTIAMNSGQIAWLGERYTGAASATLDRPPVGIQGATSLFSPADPWPSTLPGTPA